MLGLDLKLSVTQVDEDAVEGFAVLEYPQGGGGGEVACSAVEKFGLFLLSEGSMLFEDAYEVPINGIFIE